MMARITADRLIQHLTASGFVVMKGQPSSAPTTATCRPLEGERLGGRLGALMTDAAVIMGVR
jgi:hypothetical protein